MTPRSPAEAAELGKRLADEGYAIGWEPTTNNPAYVPSIEITECDTEIGGCGCGCPCLCSVAECPVCGCDGVRDDD